jgi:hypothetical protein
MDLNRLVVGEGVILNMGYPLSTRKGKLLHPLIRTVDILRRNKAPGSVLVLAAALGLGYASSEKLRTSIVLPASIAALARQAEAPPAQVAVSVEKGMAPTPALPLQAPPTQERSALVPAAVLAAAITASGSTEMQTSAAALPSIPSPYAVPANAVIVPPPAQVDAGNNMAQPSQSAKQRSQKPEEKTVSPITVLDLTGGGVDDKREQGAKPEQPGSSVVKPEVASGGAQPQVKPPAAPMPAAQAKLSAPPSVDLPKMSEVPKTKAETAKQAQPTPSVRKEPTPRAVAVQQRSSEQHEQPKARRLSETSDDGFAKPIRERQIGASSMQEGPATIQRVEVLDITRNAIIVTNPRTKLPVMVGVGDRLPNGAVLTSVNPAGGTANTSAGQLRMD